ncbi:hypothetical protein ABIE21_001395 [Conyzicola nivalis]|uniref:Uncharacterized protein n=1 Tax=Conyzicola nivalis TaxID=1477021 RepID=A0ABV2QLQ4_9MICO
MEILITVALVRAGITALVWPVWFRAQTRARRRKDPRYAPPHLMGVFDEVSYPSAYSAVQIIDVETRAPAPAPRPGGRPRL